jgi:hypothetical protein
VDDAVASSKVVRPPPLPIAVPVVEKPVAHTAIGVMDRYTERYSSSFEAVEEGEDEEGGEGGEEQGESDEEGAMIEVSGRSSMTWFQLLTAVMT